jgi:hypothetical protein
MLNAEHNSQILEIFSILRQQSELQITDSDGRWDSLVGAIFRIRGGGRGMMVWFPSDARILLSKSSGPVYGPIGLLLVLNRCHVPGFKANDIWSWDNLMLISSPRICLTYHFYVTCIFVFTWNPRAHLKLSKFLTALRNRGIFQFQENYLNTNLACCVPGVSPCIMFIWYICILSHT